MTVIGLHGWIKMNEGVRGSCAAHHPIDVP